MRFYIIVLVVALMVSSSKESLSWSKQAKMKSLIVLLASAHHRSAYTQENQTNKKKQSIDKPLVLVSADTALAKAHSQQKEDHQPNVWRRR